MSCNCWNKAIFSGDLTKLEKIRDKFDKSGHVVFNPTNYYKLFESDHTDFYRWGSDRFTPCVELKNGVLTIVGDSEWSPVHGLFGELCKDYGVSCKYDYEEVVYDFAGKMVWNEKGEVLEDLEFRYWEKLLIEDEDRFWKEFRERCELYEIYDSIKSDMHLNSWKDISRLDMSRLDETWDEYIQTKLDNYI